MQAGGTRLSLGGTAQNFGLKERGGFLHLGAERQLGESAFALGVAGGYDGVESRVNGNLGTGDRYQFGAVLHYRPGPFEASLLASYGIGSLDAARTVMTPGTPSLALGHQRYRFGQVGVDLGYRFDMAHGFVKPGLEGSWTWYKQRGFTETGADPLSLRVTAEGDAFRLTPNVQAGVSTPVGQATLSAVAKVGYSRLFRSDVGVQSIFIGAPAGVTPFTTSAFLDRDYALVDIGAEVRIKRLSARIGYTGNFGKRTTDNTFGAKVKLSF